MFYRNLAVFSIRYAKTIITIWVCFLILFGLFAVKLPAVLKDHGLRVNDGSYIKVQNMLASDFHIPEDPVILLFEKRDTVSEQQLQQFISQTLSRLQGIHGLEQVISPLSKEGMINGNFAYALLSIRHESFEMKEIINEIKHLLPKDNHITVTMTGKDVVQEDVNETSSNDLKKAEMIGIPIAFIILWLSFGGILSSMIPVLVGLIGVTITMGIMYWMGKWLDLSVFVINVIPMVGLALSIDFALMMVSRFREELQHTKMEQALITAMKTAGRAVLFSALCVFLGLSGILFIRMPIFYTVAVGAMTVLVISLLLTLTLVPALLSLIEKQMESQYVLRTGSGGGRLWYFVSDYVMSSPGRVSLFASLILISCILPASQMNLEIPDATSLPKSFESRKAAEQFKVHFIPPSTSQVFVIAEGRKSISHKNEWKSVQDLIEQLKRDPGVIRVDSADTTNLTLQNSAYATGKRTLLSVTIRGDAGSKNAMDWVRRWEQKPQDIRVLYGGEPKYQQEVFDEIFYNIKYVLLFIFISNFIILYMAFRSVLLPLKTIFMNFLSVGASFGILVWICKEGFLGMEPSNIALMIPVFIFGLTFGISMDYGVFLLSRIAEIYHRTKDNERAVREGLAITSKMITSAAAIMIAVTVPFSLGGVTGVKQLGIGIAVTILIDAVIVRIMLVPSLMKLFGKWNWWAP